MPNIQDLLSLGSTPPKAGIRVTKILAPVYVVEIFAEGRLINSLQTLDRDHVDRLQAFDQEMRELDMVPA